ncbi:tryptophan synthase subunit alpha [Desulforamulus hydrothermalis]|uniref:Tryptophan synthase alpha chain n=1 Tax=Desulforamulus hydrothermalis Lam5 = DSM 18033 TaxID=1121428 RepID=K8E0W6_9FIRM|nr:tryptophan synthase subunit alpha [Desulforamulus hydrothermalis]CCO09292.1 Tryptophan synthase alpha chain [Desulforamulus hydrothermalis Lam5 = DSM 18033]SHH04786.1 tryptophan synthase, alpha chain [Desulforamulus hydrothermalis Lam5 = DSM 18033]
MNGVERLAATFEALKKRRQKALVTYITAGDPDLAATEKLVSAMDRAGADIIELGVPFSDPSADGPVIQRAAARALARQTTPADILRLAAKLNKTVRAPLVLMSYYNPVLQYGLKDFCLQAAGAGVAGLIIPDLPPEEAEPLLGEADKAGLAIIPLAAPTGHRRRFAKIAAVARGFIYAVTVTGITGTGQNVTAEIAGLAKRIREFTDLPILAGFGIATAEQAAAVAGCCDGVVVGSALVRLVEEQGTAGIPAVTGLVRSLKEAVNKT